MQALLLYQKVGSVWPRTRFDPRVLRLEVRSAGQKCSHVVVPPVGDLPAISPRLGSLC
jgi:hypothetical protein